MTKTHMTKTPMLPARTGVPRAATLAIALAVVSVLAATPGMPAAAEPLTIAAPDTVATLLTEQRGKSVTLRLQGGEELTGIVRAVGQHLVVLAELSGREFFDAAVPLNAINAVIVRSKP